MRYLTALLAALLLVGCSQATHIPAETNVTGVNLRPLTEAGFLVTPGDYTGGEFEAMGIISVTVWPEANKVPIDKAREGGYSAPANTPEVWVQEPVTMQQALEETKQRATAMGADALTHFNVKSVTRNVEGASLDGVEVSGFAIDRVGAELSNN